jgi:hypothetical protein
MPSEPSWLFIRIGYSKGLGNSNSQRGVGGYRISSSHHPLIIVIKDEIFGSSKDTKQFDYHIVSILTFNKKLRFYMPIINGYRYYLGMLFCNALWVQSDDRQISFFLLALA